MVNFLNNQTVKKIRKDFKTMVKSLKDLKEELEYITAHLNFGNGEINTDDSMINVTIEAPNHTTLNIQFIDDEIKNIESEFMSTYIKHAIKRIDDFDPEETFNELWSPEFAKHNNFSPFQFMDILKEDDQFFKEEKDRLQKQLIQIMNHKL